MPDVHNVTPLEAATTSLVSVSPALREPVQFHCIKNFDELLQMCDRVEVSSKKLML